MAKYKVGDKIHYKGFEREENGVIVTITPQAKYNPDWYVIILDSGRALMGIADVDFKEGRGRRFWLLEDWQKERETRLKVFYESINKKPAIVEHSLEA